MVNIIFIFLFVIGILYALFTGNITNVSSSLIESPKEGLYMMFDIGALLIFWSGVLEICKQSGFLTFVTKGVTFIIHPLLFKNLDKKSKAMEYISLNLTANILGVGSAATPFGLKAMQELDEINDHDSKASADMITFVTINTSGICIIPSTLISLRETYGSTNSTIVIPYIIIISTLTTLFVIFLNKVIQKYGKH